MIDGSIFGRGASVVEKANSFCICLPANPGVDTLAAGLGLYLGLTKQGKNVSISSTGEIAATVGLAGIDKIQKTIPTEGNNLIISFPYKDGAIDKVTYNIEADRFNLLIVPKTTNDKLEPSSIKYSYTGGKVETIFTIDTPTLEALGSLYSENPDQFKGGEIINIDRHVNNANFGTINVVEKQLSSTSELVLRLLQSLNIEVNQDIATNLYAGILNATNNFTSYSVNDSTFEACAYLLKHGAIKKIAGLPKETTETIVETTPVEDTSVSRTPTSTSGQFFVEEAPSQSEKPVQSEVEKIEKKEIKEDAPKDWLKPKIFKGRNLL